MGTLVLLPWQDECLNGSPLLLMDGVGNVLGRVDIGGNHLYGMGARVLVSGSPGGASLVVGIGRHAPSSRAPERNTARWTRTSRRPTRAAA